MKTREIERALAAADPTGGAPLEGIDLEAMEADLLADVEGGQADSVVLAPRTRRARPRRGLVVATGAAAVAVVLVVVLVLGGGGTSRPERAYGAELVRFAEEGPLLLLEGPGRRVAEVFEIKTQMGVDGSMQFVTGKEPPSETVMLSWSHVAPGEAPARPPGARGWTEAPVLGTTAQIDEHAEVLENQHAPGDHTMIAYWEEDGLALRLLAAVPNLTAFKERLGWVTKTDLQSWLDAMPPEVVRASEHGAAVRDALEGVEVPAGFNPSMVPSEGLTTNEGQVASHATNTVACLWMQQWGAARRSGDTSKKAEAEKAMASSHHWPVLLEEAGEPGAGTPLTWEIADAMPRGYWLYRGHPQNLLKHAEGLGCARYGLPLLPEKQKLQEERGLPLPR